MIVGAVLSLSDAVTVQSVLNVSVFTARFSSATLVCADQWCRLTQTHTFSSSLLLLALRLLLLPPFNHKWQTKQSFKLNRVG